MDKIDILGVKVNSVSQDQAVNIVLGWLKDGSGKHYIVTPNIEFIMMAQKDENFKKILNEADLAIPDSARLGWADRVLREKNPFKKFIFWKTFLLPKIIGSNIPVTAGVDLMEALCQKAAGGGFTVGFLGGKNGVAKKASESLKKRYPELKIALAESGGEVNYEGNVIARSEATKQSDKKEIASPASGGIAMTSMDLLFVAFGAPKQEKWIVKNLPGIPVKAAMGVGGAFDYISGEVIRAPQLVRSLGLEWFFRLIIQPWRIKRFGALVRFISLVLLQK